MLKPKEHVVIGHSCQYHWYLKMLFIFIGVKVLHICPNRFRNRSSLSVCAIEDPSVIVHPDLSQADQVVDDDRAAIWEGVRALCTENVPYNRTRNNLQKASTLPDLPNRIHTVQGNTGAGNIYCFGCIKRNSLTLKDISKFSPPQNCIWSS